jgi:hypothetical protein
LGNSAATSLNMDAGDAPVNVNGGALRGGYVGEPEDSDFHFCTEHQLQALMV